MNKPQRPEMPYFSCGPTNKPLGWKEELACVNIDYEYHNRAHRAKPCKEMARDLLALSRKLLAIPDDYALLTFNDSNTHAICAAFWSMLGSRPVDVFHAGAFGKKWRDEIVQMQPCCKHPINSYGAPYWKSPSFKESLRSEHDTVIVWNETSAGTCIPENGAFLPDERDGLVIVDATSWLFAMPFPWEKADVVTWSLQKAIGGEAVGLMAVSPRAQKHLLAYQPSWPVPHLFQIRTPSGGLNPKFMDGNTINTPILSGIADSLACLRIADKTGLEEYHWRARRNFTILRLCLHHVPWLTFAVDEPDVRSSVSVTLKFTDGIFATEDEKKNAVNALVAMLGDETMAYDFANYPSAPSGLRVWCGPTVMPTDIEALFRCLNWAWEKIKH